MEGRDLTNVPILEYYGAYNPPEGPGWRNLICCFHDEKRPSARSNGKGFICNGCGVKGDALALIMQREDIDYQSATTRYEEITGTECRVLQQATRVRPFGGELSEGPRDFERGSNLFSAGRSKRSSTRIRPRFSEG